MGKKRDDYYEYHLHQDLSHTMLSDRKSALGLGAVGLLETVLAAMWRHDVGIGVGVACLVLALFRLLISVPDVAERLRQTVLLRGVMRSRNSYESSRRSSAPSDVEAATVGDSGAHSAGERAQLVLETDERSGASGGGGSGGGRRDIVDARAASCDHRVINSPLRRGVVTALSVMFGGFALALAIVHLLSPDPRMSSFPSKCEGTAGGSRIARENPWRDEGLSPLTFKAPAKEALYAVLQWVQDTDGGEGGRKEVISIHNLAADGGGPDGIVVHIRALSFLWGFADDMVVSIRCVNGDDGGSGGGGGVTGAVALVQMHGQLRIGVADWGVNPERNAQLWNYLNAMGKGTAGSSGGSPLAGGGASVCVPAAVGR